MKETRCIFSLSFLLTFQMCFYASNLQEVLSIFKSCFIYSIQQPQLLIFYCQSSYWNFMLDTIICPMHNVVISKRWHINDIGMPSLRHVEFISPFGVLFFFFDFFCHCHFVLADFFSVLVVFSFLSVYIGFDIVITVFLHHKSGFWIKFEGTIFFLKRPKYSYNLCGFTLWQFSLEYLGLL